MLGYLSDILQGLEYLPKLIIEGADAVLNGLFAALAAFIGMLFNALHAVAPMPNAPTFTGQWLGWLDWFVPIGQMVAAVTAMLSMYLGWMLLRWAFQLIKMGGEGV